MLRIKELLALACVVILPFFISCDKIEDTETQTPSSEVLGDALVKLDIYELDITGGGGTIPIFYGIVNPRSGATLDVKSNVDWITVKEITKTTIMLDIAPSDIDEERMGFVTINYEGMPSAIKVLVMQDAQLLDKFSFEVVEATTTTCKVKYTPKQNGNLFMANIIDSAYFIQSGITDMSIFVEAEMANYLALAAQHEMTLEYLLTKAVSPELLFTKEVTRSFINMKPGGTYVAYAYGLELHDNEYTVTIPMHQMSITIPMQSMYDVKFNISSQLSSSGVANIAVSPQDWSGYYSVNIIPDSSVFYIPQGSLMNEYTVRAIGDDFYKRARQAMQSGVTVEAFLKSSCYVGNKTFNMAVSGGSKYMVAVYAVESIDGAIPTMCSMPSISYL